MGKYIFLAYSQQLLRDDYWDNFKTSFKMDSDTNYCVTMMPKPIQNSIPQ